VRTINVDDMTYADWQRRAQAKGLSVEDWLKLKTNGDDTGFDPAEQLSRLDQFAANQKDYGGKPQFDRHDLYD